MTEWTVVGVLIALCGLLATVVKPMLTLNTAITRLTARLDALSGELQELTDHNRQSHDRLWERVTELENAAAQHDRALAILQHCCDAGSIQN